MRSTADRLLRLLAGKPRSAADYAAHVGVTADTVPYHLAALDRRGLVNRAPAHTSTVAR